MIHDFGGGRVNNNYKETVRDYIKKKKKDFLIGPLLFTKKLILHLQVVE